MTGREALAWAAAKLQEAGVESPRLDAEVLLRHVMGWSRVNLLANLQAELSPQKQAAFAELVAGRARRVPLQYLVGTQEFMSLAFKVTPQVLIPRADTETLVEEALRLIDGCGFQNAADIGTGSGAIACSLAYYTRVNVWATDISRQALAVARDNARSLGVAHKIEFFQGDLAEPLVKAGVQVDLLAANLPYIPAAEIDKLQPELNYEPRMALDGGDDGLEIYRRLLSQARQVLKDGGYLLLEIGWNQSEEMEQVIRENGFEKVVFLKDYGGRHRVAKVSRKGF